MIVYVEVFPADKTNNRPTITQLVMSSDGRTSAIAWKNKKDEAIVNMLRSIYKQVPVSEREYDDKMHVWTFFGHRGEVIIAGIESMITQGMLPGTEIKKIEDLVERNNINSLNRPLPKFQPGEKKFSDDDFFHSAPASSNEPSGAKLVEQLAPLLGLTVTELTNENDNDKLKKIYRRAALRFHPDRNNGNATQMTELNYLWNIFMQRA